MRILLLFFLTFVTPALLWASSQGEELRVYQLAQQGWQIQEKESFIDKRPGLKPYQNLRRDVQVVLYRLQRGEDVLFCRVEYDSQQDTIRESCASSAEEAAERLTD